MNYNLCNAVYHQSLSNPNQLALAAEGKEYSYQKLANLAASIAEALKQSPTWKNTENQPPRIAILASRSAIACMAVLGACWSGATYIPLGTKIPEERILTLLSLCNFSALIADNEGAKLLTEKVMSACPPIVLMPEPQKQEINKNINLYDIHKLPLVANSKPAMMRAEDLAYIIFTSGTTGVPKGVMITCGAIQHYIKTVTSLLGLNASDRAIETLELTFDVSLHTMFTTWEAGASLHILPAHRVMGAVKFVRDHKLTVWFSVPSLAGMLKEIKTLTTNSLSDLRVSVFGGEQLPEAVISAWQQAAPNSRIENYYGPTEATVFCLTQTVSDPLPLTPGRDILSIGKPLPNNEAAIVNENQQFLKAGEIGELALAGVQLSAGYLNSPELTNTRFPIIEGKRWYLTGDLAMQDSEGCFHCLGRIDNQVKVLGHRIELEEVDACLRKVSNNGVVATVAWPVQDGAAQGLVSFVNATQVDAQLIRNAMKNYLPIYMVPSRIIAIDPMPFNQSGKIDRRALLKILQEEMPKTN